jgi:hypothetical protein
MELVKGSRKGEFKTIDDTVVCSPQVFPSPNLKQKEIERNAGRFNVHELYDGTLINLYYYAGTWHLGSARADDLTDKSYSTTATFGQLFDEVIMEYPDFGYERLDKSRTYTIGFSHPAMHNTTTSKRAWTYYDDIGIPKPEMTPLECAARLKTLIKQCRETSYTHPSKLFGYVLVPSAAEGGSRKSYVVQTRLWKLINSCQNQKIPVDEAHSYSKRSYMIARTVVTFHELALMNRDAAKLKIAEILPGLAVETERLEKRIAFANVDDANIWVANVLRVLAASKGESLTPTMIRNALLTTVSIPHIAALVADEDATLVDALAACVV